MNPIFERVSIRKFEDRPVEQEKIEKILRAGMQAPSSKNQQPWEFYVVRNKEKLLELSKVHKYSNFVKDAPMAIVPCYNTDKEILVTPEHAHVDLANASQFMLLEITALGLGATWIGIAPLEENMAKVNKILDIPDNLQAFCIMPVGYPAEGRPQQDRYHAERVHIEE